MKPFSPLALCLVLLLSLGSALRAAEATLERRLSDGWEYYRGSLGSVWEIWRGDRATDNVVWTKVALPHCFNAMDAVDPDTPYYQGPGWYRTRLDVKNPFPGGRTLLRFDGAGQQSRVYVGMEQVSEHVGGYDGWWVDITEASAKALQRSDSKGQVPVAVWCDNSRQAEMIPSDLSDFNRYGGLYRHVTLAYVPAVSLERVHVTPTVLADGTAKVAVRARLHNPDRRGGRIVLRIEMRDPSGGVVHTSKMEKDPWTDWAECAVASLPNPKRWSPAVPQLYSATVTLESSAGVQTVASRFGLRTVEWMDKGPFKLNGERLLLRGTHYHEDHAGVAAAVPDEVVRRTLRQIKDMGANFVRLGHYQQAPLVLELCDELGLLVWEEIPWCRGGLGGERYRQQARDMLKGMIEQHYNHPSVILWGLGNENDWPGDFETFDKEEIRSFMKELNDLAHRLDPARKTSIRRCDFCKDIVDVYSPSIWAGWYSGRYREYRASSEKHIASVKHFFHAEWGGDSHARRFAENPESMLEKIATGRGTAEVGSAYKAAGGPVRMSKDGDWSESYMANLFDWHLKEQEQMPQLTGAAQWIFKDFATPLRPENPVPRVNQKGLVERDGTPKEAYYIFQSYWAEKPMLRIFGHEWRTRWGAAGEPKEVRVYSNCAEVELFHDGASLGVRKRASQDWPAAGLRWMVPLKAGENRLKAVGRPSGGSATPIVDEITVGYETRRWGKPARLELVETRRSGGRVTIEARLYDAKGVPCLDAANLVRFEVIGSAVLRANLGLSTAARAVQLYNGRAEISLDLHGPRAIASVAAEGVETAFLEVRR